MDYSFSIIIPVYKEIELIQKTLSKLPVDSPKSPIEIIVVDGDKNGSTINTIGTGNIKKTTAPRGRAYQMNKGASLSRGNILIFLHADTFLPHNALIKIQAALNGTHRVGGAFELGIDSPKKYFRLIEAAVKFRTRLTKIPYGDQAIFIKKDYFRKIGGFPQATLMEDVALMQRIKKRGGSIVILPIQVQTSARRWENEGIIFCTVRNWVLLFLYFIGFPPNRLTKLYYRNDF